MNKPGFLLALALLFTMGAVPYTIVSHTHTAPPDSTIVNTAQPEQSRIPNGAVVQKLNFTHPFKRTNSDCIESFSDSTSPRIKILVPDTSLTASMPVLKPKPVDQKIFIPGFGCRE